MRSITFRFVVASFLTVLLAAWPGVVSAQSYTTTTTTSAAMTASQTTVGVSSATNVAAGSSLFVVDGASGKGELMDIVSVSSTTATVRRGVGGMSGTAHASGSLVYAGTNDRFSNYDVSGVCSSTTIRYLPHINVASGAVFDCDPGIGVWLQRLSDPVNVRQFTVRDSFDQGYNIMQDDGTAKSVTDDEDNFVAGSPLGAIEYREELGKTVSSWFGADGTLDVSADDGATDAEGVDILFGSGQAADLGVIVAGTQGACFEVSLDIADVSGSDFVEIGWRQNEEFVDNGTVVSYTVWNAMGIHNSEDGSIFSAQEVSEATDTDDSGVNWADGDTRALKSCISKAGVPTGYYSDAYTTSQVLTDWPVYNTVTLTNTGSTLTAGTQLFPFFILLHSDEGDDSDIRLHWAQITRIP